MTEAQVELAFVDCETTNLDVETGVIWQLYIEKAVWTGDGLTSTASFEALIRPAEDEMLLADPESLRINRFHDVLREREHEFVHGWSWDLVEAVHQMLNNTWVVGAVPSFDMARLERILCGTWHLAQNWHHRLVCVENLAAAKLGQQPPWSPRNLAERLGVERNPETMHDARHDVIWAMKMYEAVYG